MITKTHVESSEIIKGPLERTSTLGLELLAPCPAQLAKAEIWGGGEERTWFLFISPEIPALSCFAERSLPNVHCTPMGRSRILGGTALSRRCLFGGLETQQTREGRSTTDDSATELFLCWMCTVSHRRCSMIHT